MTIYTTLLLAKLSLSLSLSLSLRSVEESKIRLLDSASQEETNLNAGHLSELFNLFG